MNKMLVVIFDTEKAADAGTHALRKLHDEGGVTLYASAVIARDGNAVALKEQVSQAKGDVKARLEDRVKRAKSAYHVRGAKPSQAWGLTKAALAV
ncbi:MAG TPA: hypothetical protein VII31_01420 [Caldimonas sp.]